MMINIYRWHSFHGKPTSCYIVLSPLARMTNTSRIPHISPCICRLAARWERIKTWLKIGRVWEVQQVAVADVAVGQKDKADMATLNRLWSCGAGLFEAIKAKTRFDAARLHFNPMRPNPRPGWTEQWPTG